MKKKDIIIVSIILIIFSCFIVVLKPPKITYHELDDNNLTEKEANKILANLDIRIEKN